MHAVSFYAKRHIVKDLSLHSPMKPLASYYQMYRRPPEMERHNDLQVSLEIHASEKEVIPTSERKWWNAVSLIQISR